MPAGGAVAPPGVLGDVGLAGGQHEREGEDLGTAVLGLSDQVGQTLAELVTGRLLPEPFGGRVVAVDVGQQVRVSGNHGRDEPGGTLRRGLTGQELPQPVAADIGGFSAPQSSAGMRKRGRRE
jgi:hypothetical protein